MIFKRKKKLMRKMLEAVDLIKMGLYVRLKSKFLLQYDKDFSGSLAGAIINELFSESLSKQRATEFYNSNKELIVQEIENLKNSKEIKNAITKAVRVKQTVYFAENRISASSMIEPIEKLEKLGFLIPGGESPNPKNFIPMAINFYKSSVSDPET
jgi:hypothetical protein